jgi:hypothetical protein
MGASLNQIFPNPGKSYGGCGNSGCTTCGCGKYPEYPEYPGMGCSSCAQPPAPVPPPSNDNYVPPADDGAWANPYGDMAIADQPPQLQLVEDGDPRLLPNVVSANVVSAARGLMGEPQEQSEPEHQQEAPQAQGPTMSGTATVMSLMNRRRRR